MKTLMVLFLVAVLVALASAGVFMMRRGNSKEAHTDRSKHMARALAVRVGLSVALFLLILLSWAMGWVQPTGLPTGR
jgi:hypothetical protein